MVLPSLILLSRPVPLFAAIIGLVIFGVSCGGPEVRMREKAVVEPYASPTQGEREISGVFNVDGSEVNGNNPYTGVLTISNQGDVYGFRWSTTKGARVGTGVQLGSSTAASFASTGAGAGCGVVLYRIASDGSLEGRIGNWGESGFGIERATRGMGSGLVGKYTIAGSTLDRKTYGGRLTITKDGSGYNFEWLRDFESDPDKAFVGFGIWKGSYAAVSYGGRQCSFALYDIQSNGNLDGDWGGQSAVTFGTETAKIK